MPKVIIPLNQAADLPSVGGKASNLASLISVGLPVPSGFVVTVEAYRKFLSDHGLEGKISSQLASADLSDEIQLEGASSAIKSMIKSAPGLLRRPAGHLPQRGGRRCAGPHKGLLGLLLERQGHVL